MKKIGKFLSFLILAGGAAAATWYFLKSQEDDADFDDYDDDIITARLGLNYTLNRFLQLYGRVEYQVDMCDSDYARHDYDYDRFRGTVGMRLTY